jgi:hypothetical protein
MLSHRATRPAPIHFCTCFSEVLTFLPSMVPSVDFYTQLLTLRSAILLLSFFPILPWWHLCIKHFLHACPLCSRPSLLTDGTTFHFLRQQIPFLNVLVTSIISDLISYPVFQMSSWPIQSLSEGHAVPGGPPFLARYLDLQLLRVLHRSYLLWLRVPI